MLMMTSRSTLGRMALKKEIRRKAFRELAVREVDQVLLQLQVKAVSKLRIFRS